MNGLRWEEGCGVPMNEALMFQKGLQRQAVPQLDPGHREEWAEGTRREHASFPEGSSRLPP